MSGKASSTTTNTTASIGSSTSSSCSSSTSFEWPQEMPTEVLRNYEGIRLLGKGGFGSVTLARKVCDTNAGKDEQHDEELVAIKVIGNTDATRVECGYARREIDILRELDHPNIVGLVESWFATSCAGVVALEYASGPTLKELITEGGAFCPKVGLAIMAQLVDAVAYLHGRAVCHRDIKPANIVVTVRNNTPNERKKIWSTKDEKNTVLEEATLRKEANLLQKQYHVTLVDFGFARALSPQDLQNQPDASPSVVASITSTSSSSFSRPGKNRRNRGSVSGRVCRMSALGTQMYGAPEIFEGAYEKSSQNLSLSASNTSTTTPTGTGLSASASFSSSLTLSRNGSNNKMDITNTFLSVVADYGMLSDAYALGNTLKYMMTGVTPNLDDTTQVQRRRQPLRKLARWMEHRRRQGVLFAIGTGTISSGSSSQNSHSYYHYRALSELPETMTDMIRSMSNPDESDRLSIRACRRSSFIRAVLSGSTTNTNESNDLSQEIHHLSFTTHHHHHHHHKSSSRTCSCCTNSTNSSTNDKSDQLFDTSSSLLDHHPQRKLAAGVRRSTDHDAGLTTVRE